MFKLANDVESIIKIRFNLDIFSRSRKAPKHSLPERVIRANKLIAKEQIRNNITTSAQMQQFFNWICGIQRKLQLNDEQFAKALGLTSSRSIRQYRNLEGHFPSKKTIKKLLKLEKLMNTCVYRPRKYANV